MITPEVGPLGWGSAQWNLKTSLEDPFFIGKGVILLYNIHVHKPWLRHTLSSTLFNPSTQQQQQQKPQNPSGTKPLSFLVLSNLWEAGTLPVWAERLLYAFCPLSWWPNKFGSTIFIPSKQTHTALTNQTETHTSSLFQGRQDGGLEQSKVNNKTDIRCPSSAAALRLHRVG